MMSCESSVRQMQKMLVNLDTWLAKAVAHAEKKSFDPNVYLASRLAPDQYPLSRQVQVACDIAKQAAAGYAGEIAPKHPDTEQTMTELRTRIQTVTNYLESIKPERYAGANERKVPLPFMPGKGMSASNYLTELSTPNFYFHLVLAYAILRHNGVELGKQEYIGGLTLIDM